MRSQELGGVGLDLTAVRLNIILFFEPLLNLTSKHIPILMKYHAFFLYTLTHLCISFYFYLLQDPVPPEDPFIQVRVLCDYGDAAFTSGSVKLRRGQSHWLPRDEAHGLIIEGVLECVGGVENCGT
jgi:hypothetical protein